MNDSQIKILRDFILRALKRFPRGATLETVCISCQSGGFGDLGREG